MIGFAIGAFGVILALFGICAFLVAIHDDTLTGLIMGGALFIVGIAFIFYGGYLL